ncbi:MAG: TonB-dependent receptor [Alphaproteobacteria bacterium]|nr:TonB-dependent receptor [Alphaproteobacteria bacterium]
MSVRFLNTSSLLALAACALTMSPARAQQSTPLPPVSVETANPVDGLNLPICHTEVGKKEIDAKSLSTSDTARLLDNVPGVDTYTGGGISGLPSIHGLASDRIRTEVNGMPITSACPNHMNPALSYIAPQRVGKVQVWTGITPVSEGGDSIGGTIKVESPPPVFAGKDEAYHTEGSLSSFYRSNSYGFGGAVSATGATENFSLTYSGSGERASDYHRGGKDNNAVLYSRHINHNHALAFAAQHENHLLTVEGGLSYIPQQGYPNQRMDMVDNKGKYINTRYQGDFDWGKLDGRVYYHYVTHVMDFIDGAGKFPTMPGMPMYSEGTDIGYSVKAEIPINERHTLRVGNEIHRFMLDDWWPPYGTGGMFPLSFENINSGVRDQIGTFAEWEAKWTPQWTTLFGMRNDTIMMDAGRVHGYKDNSTTYTIEAGAFNDRDRAKTDINFDLTALTRFEPDKKSTYELGYAMKTRSPNLYERYTWSSATMPSEMNGWYGDANGYTGSIDIDPETAHTLSLSAEWHDDSPAQNWMARITPYVTYIRDYIGVKQIGFISTSANTAKLKFANMDAELHGIDLSGHYALSNTPDYGRFVMKGTLGWVQGRVLNAHHEESGFYHLMPLNSKLGLEHNLGGWNSVIETRLVDSKTQIDNLRREPKTPAYALFNLRSSYSWENITFGAGIDNLFNKLYYEPLGGRAYGDYNQYSNNAGAVGPVAGMGRSYNAGLTIKF